MRVANKGGKRVERAICVDRDVGRAAVENAGHELLAVHRQLSAFGRNEFAVHRSSAVAVDDIAQLGHIADDVVQGGAWTRVLPDEVVKRRAELIDPSDVSADVVVVVVAVQGARDDDVGTEVGIRLLGAAEDDPWSFCCQYDTHGQSSQQTSGIREFS